MSIERINDRWWLDKQRAKADEILVYTTELETLNAELQAQIDSSSVRKDEGYQSSLSTSRKIFENVVGVLAGLGILTLLYWVWNFRAGIWTGIANVFKAGLIGLGVLASMAVLLVLIGLVAWLIMKVIRVIKNQPSKEERKENRIKKTLDSAKSSSQ